MFKSLFNPMPGAGFFGTKLGQAAIASTFAMTAMVVLTTQVGEASAANVAASTAHAFVEIA
ncbi:hypothetical protein [Erythrobacter sp.]|uniref:hypothetical protein n=1 Tax=Erythrobacter sp. TaxID=1042 RepID=UPI001425E583|nr:hypothetical protein [Erythrobacter sp.]QIQ85232.1 MAG: hypothetical protein G9473_01510 [Erythrobacter sp.]